MQIYSDKKALAKRKRIFRIKIYFSIFLIALLGFGVYYLITYSSVFKIKNIIIEDNRFLSDSEVLRDLRQYVLAGVFAGQAGFDNMFSWPSGKISVFNPAISEIVISKDWIKMEIEARVKERERFAIWCVAGGSSCYWMDRGGIVFAEAPLTEGSLVFTIFADREDFLLSGSRVEDDRFAGNLIAILENLNKTGFEIKRIEFNRELQELTVETMDGPKLFFSDRFDVSQNMSLIKDINLKNAEYIDLRVENKIYSKNKN